MRGFRIFDHTEKVGGRQKGRDFSIVTATAHALRLLTNYARETPAEFLEEVRTEEYT